MRASPSVALSLALATSPVDADAVASVGQKPPPTISTPEGCTLRALDAFADVRAKFSLEVSTGALPEAVLTLTGCDYSGEARCEGRFCRASSWTGRILKTPTRAETEMSRTSARNANLRGYVQSRARTLYDTAMWRAERDTDDGVPRR